MLAQWPKVPAAGAKASLQRPAIWFATLQDEVESAHSSKARLLWGWSIDLGGFSVFCACKSKNRVFGSFSGRERRKCCRSCEAQAWKSSMKRSMRFKSKQRADGLTIWVKIVSWLTGRRKVASTGRMNL
jgi:hypothetical protein